MTKPEFVAAHYHELCGMLADAYCVNRQGVELSRSQQYAFSRVKELLSAMYDELATSPVKRLTPEANGTPTPGVKKT